MTEYWKTKLDDLGRQAYDELFIAATTGAMQTEFSGDKFNNEIIFEAFNALMRDHAELFFVGMGIMLTTAEYGFAFMRSVKITVTLKQLYPFEQIAEITTEMEKIADDLARSYDGTVEGAERAICQYLVKYATYELDETYNQNAAAALYFKKAQCSGIARAVKYVMDRLGKWCMVVSGDAKGNDGKYDAHAWNIVKTDEGYRHLDATYLMGANRDRPAAVRYKFFNYTDEQIKATHKWDYSTAPRCAGTADAKSEKPTLIRRVTPAEPPKPAPPTPDVPVISTPYEFKSLLQKSKTGEVSFIYEGEGTADEKKKLLTNTLKFFCKTGGISAAPEITLSGKVWTARFKK